MPTDTIPIDTTAPYVPTLWDTLLWLKPVGTCHFIHKRPYDPFILIDTTYDSVFELQRRDSIYVDVIACGWNYFEPIYLPVGTTDLKKSWSTVVHSSLSSLSIDLETRTIHAKMTDSPLGGPDFYSLEGNWSF